MSSGADRVRGPDPARGVGFWLSVAAGAALAGFGAHTAVRSRDAAPIAGVVRWLAAALLIHDVVVASAVGLTGWALARRLPSWVSGPVRGAAALSAVVVAFSYPLWARRGADPLNPSRLPLHYPTAVLTVLALVWGVGVAVAGWRWRSRRHPR